MSRTWFIEAKRAFYIAEKDAKIYFFKAPNLTFGLLLPVVLYLAFSLDRTVDPLSAVPGFNRHAVPQWRIYTHRNNATNPPNRSISVDPLRTPWMPYTKP